MRALSIRQPYAELILRGIRPIEFSFGKLTAGCSRPARIIGKRFYIYASQQWAAGEQLKVDVNLQFDSLSALH